MSTDSRAPRACEPLFEGLGGYAVRTASHQLAGELREALFANWVLQAPYAKRELDIDERKYVARFD